MNKNLGENLIFIISQPRAGSTLLQRILSSHPEIYTTAEPWIMLHPMYALRRKGLWAEYDVCLAHNALEDFLKGLPHGQVSYIEAIRQMYISLYKGALNSTGKTYFLDKTPRYYFIIPELYRLFPKAKYIILLRNPLAVLASMLNTWVKDDWCLLSQYRYDLLAAPQLLLEGADLLADKGITVHYEELVSTPEEITKRLCSYLNLEFNASILEYGKQKAPSGSMGDPVEIHKHSRPVPDYADKWVDEFTSRQTRHFADSYLKELGPDLLKRLGYSFDELKIKLASHKIEKKKSSVVIPWKLLVDFNEHRSTWDDVKLKILLNIQSKGFLRTVFKTIEKIARFLKN